MSFAIRPAPRVNEHPKVLLLFFLSPGLTNACEQTPSDVPTLFFNPGLVHATHLSASNLSFDPQKGNPLLLRQCLKPAAASLYNLWVFVPRCLLFAPVSQHARWPGCIVLCPDSDPPCSHTASTRESVHRRWVFLYPDPSLCIFSPSDSA
jgi:hypothetical protein